MELDSNGNFRQTTFLCSLFAGNAIQLFSDVINLDEALLKSEAEEKSMWAERLSSERTKKEEVDDEVATREEKAPSAAEYQSPPKTEAEAIFRLLDVNRQGFVTRKVILARALL